MFGHFRGGRRENFRRKPALPAGLASLHPFHIFILPRSLAWIFSTTIKISPINIAVTPTEPFFPSSSFQRGLKNIILTLNFFGSDLDSVGKNFYTIFIFPWDLLMIESAVSSFAYECLWLWFVGNSDRTYFRHLQNFFLFKIIYVPQFIFLKLIVSITYDIFSAK